MHHVPCPAKLAGDRVVALDHARGSVPLLPVENLMSGHDHASDDGRRRGDRHHPGIGLSHPRGDVYLAVDPEFRTGLPGPRIDRDDPRIERPLDDPRGADRVRRRAGNRVITHSAASRRVGDILVGHLGVEAPSRLPRDGVERDHDALGGTEIEAVADLQRRGLGAVIVLDVGRVRRRQVAGVINPGPFELADVGGRNLRER